MTAESPPCSPGELRMYRRIVGDSSPLVVHEAPPRVLISAGLLEEFRRSRRSEVRLVGDTLTIAATNRRVVYRIGERLAEADAYVAERVA